METHSSELKEPVRARDPRSRPRESDDSRILLKDFDVVVTMDSEQRELHGSSVLVQGRSILAVGQDATNSHADIVIDGAGKVLLPGFVNTHHHLYQTVLRNAPAASDRSLHGWLAALYGYWSRLDESAIGLATQVSCAELILSGATTTSDFHYIFPKTAPHAFDAVVRGASSTGIRFHPCRGSYTLPPSQGGLVPDSLVETESAVLEDSVRVIERYHDSAPFAMVRVGLGPCGPLRASPSFFERVRELAAETGALLHTHLAETKEEEEYCLEKFGMRPVEYLRSVGWLQRNAWFAHLVHVTDEDIRALSEAGAGMSYCPTSNMVLGSGVAPVARMAGTGVRVSIGVDGSASNDTSSMIREIRQAMLLQRVRFGADAMTAREALRIATIGGADVLGRGEELGSIEPGKAADLIAFDISGIEFAGAHADPVAALVHCAADRVDFSMVNGRILVRGGVPCDESWVESACQLNQLSRELIADNT
ncbi:8-oxoguanine deaminase, partial [Candidatus Bipolaricaulota bacterium]